MGRLTLNIHIGKDTKVVLYSDNQGNIIEGLDKLQGVNKSIASSLGDVTACKLTIKKLNYEKKLYTPCKIVAVVSFPVDITHTDIKGLFLGVKVELKSGNSYIAQEYYVHSVFIKSFNDGASSEVTFEIYSKDKKLTIHKFCKSYSGRKLFYNILSQQKDEWPERESDDPPTDFGTNLPESTLLTDTGVVLNKESRLSYLSYIALEPMFDEKGNPVMEEKDGEKVQKTKDVKREFIQPYLVQYNESFYDFIARTANRCGEFLFFEDGKFNLGLNNSLYNEDFEKGLKIENNSDIKEIVYSSISYHDSYSDNKMDDSTYYYYDGTQESKNKLGTYNYNWDIPLDDYLMTLKGNQFTNYLIEWTGIWQKKIFEVLDKVLNNEDIPGLLGGLIGEAIGAVVPAAFDSSGKINATYNSRFIDSLRDEQKYTSDKNVVVGTPFSTNYTNDMIKFKRADNLNTAFYALVKNNEEYVSQNALMVDLGTTDDVYKLGSLVKLKGTYYVVGEVIGSHYVLDGVTYANTQLLLLPLIKGEKPEIMWAAPPYRSVELVRKATPQVATIARNEDPSGLGRVRIRYPWQTEKEDMSPWIRMTTPFATTDGGLYLPPNENDEVLVDYENGNVERPYVVGALYSKKAPVYKGPQSVSVKTGSDVVVRTISSANGHRITMTDPKGVEEFIENLWGGYKWLKLMDPFNIMSDILEDCNGLTGGIELGDKYGLYSIKMSTSERLISIRSPFGDVKIDAFTGISLHAPNGKISIYGKDVEIKAGNTLTMTSGAHLSDDPRSVGEMAADFFKFDFLPTITNVAFDEFLGSFVDLRLLRTILEAFMRPKAGTMKIKSLRFMLLEAGKGRADIPNSAFTTSGIRYQLDQDQSETKEVCDLMVSLPGFIDAWVQLLQSSYSECRVAKDSAFNTLKQITKESDTKGWDGNNINTLKSKLNTYVESCLSATSCPYKESDFVFRTTGGLIAVADKKDVANVMTNLYTVYHRYLQILATPENELEWCKTKKPFYKKSRPKLIQDAKFAETIFENVEDTKKLLSTDQPELNVDPEKVSICKRKFMYLYMKTYTRLSSTSNVTFDLASNAGWGKNEWVSYIDELAPDSRTIAGQGWLASQLTASVATLKDKFMEYVAIPDFLKSRNVWGSLTEGEILFSDKDGNTINFNRGHLNHKPNVEILDVLKRRLKDM